MVDLSSLTDAQLKSQLLHYGVKAGPIVGSTRALYERKLQRLMAHSSQFKFNGTSDAAKYSDSEEDEGEEEEEEEEDEEESGSEQLGPESVSRTETSATARTVGLYSQSKDLIYPQCFSPALRQGKKRGSLESSRSSSQSFSITELVEEIENRLSPQSKPAATERCSQMPKEKRVLWDLQQLNKNTMTNTSLYLTPQCLPHQKQTTTIKPACEPVTDILTELFPDTVTTPTGITATKRRSIKGAAGRPVQFKYLETPLSPATLERREIQHRLVPLWVQIVVFLLLAALLYLIYVSIEDPLENPFSVLLDSLSDEPALAPSSQDVSTSEVAA
uniref:Uncharacterized protein n=2 Tax=Pygocentrus nattereri TaxID=42514 RepID=A0A3B4BS32_PYGNA